MPTSDPTTPTSTEGGTVGTTTNNTIFNAANSTKKNIGHISSSSATIDKKRLKIPDKATLLGKIENKEIRHEKRSENFVFNFFL